MKLSHAGSRCRTPASCESCWGLSFWVVKDVAMVSWIKTNLWGLTTPATDADVPGVSAAQKRYVGQVQWWYTYVHIYIHMCKSRCAHVHMCRYMLYIIHPQYMQIRIIWKYPYLAIYTCCHVEIWTCRQEDIETYGDCKDTLCDYMTIYIHIVLHRYWQIASCATKTFNTSHCRTFDVISMQMVERERLAQSITGEWFQTVRSFPTTSKCCTFFFPFVPGQSESFWYQTSFEIIKHHQHDQTS